MPAGPASRRAADPALATGRGRLKLVAVGFAVAFVSIALRLVDMIGWQPTPDLAGAVLPPPAMAALPAAWRELPTTSRADIVDRHGVVLATNLRVPSVYADPALLADKAEAARRLAAILPGVDPVELARRFERSRRFAWVKHRITPEEQAAVLELGLPGVGFKLAEHRVYPKENLASHVLGYVDLDNRGLAGIEHRFDQRLREDAEPLALSLDVRVQQIVQDELSRALARFRAVGANAIVLDRITGEVLAMASLPDFDPNRRTGDGSRIEYLNRNTAGVYELGSVFKILSTAMALDSGRVALTDRFDATGKLQIGRFRIGDDHAQNRVLSLPEVFQHSSNIGTARMTFAAGGAPPLEAFFRRVGFYAPPQIELPEAARPTTPRRWPEVTVATTSYGHGIAVTPLHLVDAVAGLIGDDGRVPPTLLKRAAGELPPRERLVSPRTAADLRWLLWFAVEQGTGMEARLGSYLIGGKTGTADKPVNGRYRGDAVLASFIAAFPIHEPRYLVFVVLDEPQGDAASHGLRYAGWTAAPVAATIVDRIGPLLGVPPTPPEALRAMQARLKLILGASPQGRTLQEAQVATGRTVR